MIEILILYTINSREKTIYSIRKEIIEKFGNITVPSLGTIHPALKRMLSKNYVTVNERMSEGGKKSSFYLVTNSGKKFFIKHFLDDCSHNPCLYYGQIQARFATMGLLPKDKRIEFLDKMIFTVDNYTYEKTNSLENEFLNLDFYQKELIKQTIDEAQTLKKFALKLKEHDEC